MYSSTFMRALILFTSLASLPLFVSALPINALEIFPDGSMVERTLDEREAYAGRHNGTAEWMTERSYETEENGVLVRRVTGTYTLNCAPDPHAAGTYKDGYAEICANICYYQHCKGGSLVMHAQPGRTVAAACAPSYNKCSTGHKGPAGKYPHTGYQCDEFPLASSTEGGNRNAATRCVPGRQNGSAGGKFQFAPGTVVTTVLLNTNHAPFYCDGNCDTSRDGNGRQA